jgi:large subunit ribosomal protein L14e
VNVSVSAGHKKLVKEWKKDDILGKWAKTAKAQKLARQKLRMTLTDFQRFKVMVLRKKVRR